MDSEPVARALLVTGVTYVTVGLVTLSLGIIFLVVELQDVLLAVWSVAIASGVCSIVAGGLLASLSCNQRSARPASLFSVIAFTFTIVLTVGTEVALLVLSTFHVLKDEKWKEIFIFFIASSGIQLVALVLASLLLLTCNERIVNEKYRHRLEVDPQDNYGFIGDSEMWCSARAPRGQSLVRWPGLDRLDAPVNSSNPDMAFRSSSSSVGSVHPGHYIAGDHHPRYIAPSSTGESGSFDSPSPSEEAEAEAGQTEYHAEPGRSVVQAEVHGSPKTHQRHQNGIILSPSAHAEALANYADQNGTPHRDYDSSPPIPARRYHIPPIVPTQANGRPKWHSSSPTRPSSRLDGYDHWNELSQVDDEVGLPPVSRQRSRSSSPTKTERNDFVVLQQSRSRSTSPSKARDSGMSPQHARGSSPPSPWRSRPTSRETPSQPSTPARTYSPATSLGQQKKRIFLYNPLEVELPGMTQPQRKKGSGHVSPGASPTFHTWSIDRKSISQRRYVNGSGAAAVPMTTTLPHPESARVPSRMNGHTSPAQDDDVTSDHVVNQPWPPRKDIFSRHNFHNVSATSLHSLNQPPSTLPNGYKYNHLIPRSKPPPPPPTRHVSKRGSRANGHVRRPRDPPPAVPAYVTRPRQYYDPNFNYRTFSDVNGVPLGHVFTVEGWKGMNGHHVSEMDNETRPRKVTFMEADV